MESEISKKLETVALLSNVAVVYLSETTSTNDVAKDDRYGDMTVIVTDYQSSGRGQRGNVWSSGTGHNLMFSIVVKPEELEITDQFFLSKAVAVATADTLRAYGIEAEVKWPNDIYVGNRKIAGILIENDLMGAYLTKSVIGIGLNVNQTEFFKDLPNAVSMSLLTGLSYDRAEVLKRFLEFFRIEYNILQRGDFEAIDRKYHSMLYRRDGVFEFRDTDSGELFDAEIKCVEPSGEIVLVNGDIRKKYFFKEVEFL